MQNTSLTGDDVSQYFEEQSNKSMLRFITCGSVDDGKSTLIGRLLHDSKQVFDDQMAALERDSTAHGTQGGEIDFALLVDGLSSEREQGITIDVAYRFFSTDQRKFIVADTPGHEQYTRNMATGASTADLAVILIDARSGVLTQTRRHTLICALLEIPNLVVAVNKMDLVEYDQSVFDAIENDFRNFTKELEGDREIIAIPISALNGEGITVRGGKIDWYKGPTLLSYLETVDVQKNRDEAPARLPVQWVNRPNLDVRGFCGRLSSGTLSKGDAIRIVPSGKTSTVKEISIGSTAVDKATSGRSVMVTMEDEVDISRGDVICHAEDACSAADQFEAHILWMAEPELLPGRRYILKTAARQTPASITKIKYRIDVNTSGKMAADNLQMNEVGLCNISCTESIAFDAYHDNRTTGSFILIDRMTDATVALGMINFSLNRAQNVHYQDTQVDRFVRSHMKGHGPAVVWFTGLSGSGKSTIADLLEQKLAKLGIHTMLLDGDNVRHGLNRDLGFTDSDRVENIRRISEVCRLMFDAGIITIVSFISPFRSERRVARQTINTEEEDNNFFEIFVDVPLEVAEARDVKGLYRKARLGQIKNFTGISSPYEEPQNAELVLKADTLSPNEAADQVIDLLRQSGHVPT